MPHLKQ